MKCLHICNDFSLTKVHSRLYGQLDLLGVEQIIFNPVRKSTPIGNNKIDFVQMESRIVHSKEIKKIHRFLLRAKINFLYDDLTKKISIPEISFCHATTLFSDGALAYKLKKKFNIPYLVAVRATDIHVFLKYRPDLLFLGLNILSNASKIIFISESLKKNFLEHVLIKPFQKRFKEKCEVIYNGIDSFWLENRKYPETKRPEKFLYVGRLIRRKNIVPLIEAIHILNDKGQNCELTIVGDGPESGIVEQSIKDKDYIHYIGPVTNKNELLKIYREHDVFAMPSKGETFGLVYIEALSQGLPLLFARNEGVDGVFHEWVGNKCNQTDVDGISNALHEFFRFPPQQLPNLDLTCFDWKNIAKKYFDIYEKEILI